MENVCRQSRDDANRIDYYINQPCKVLNKRPN